MPAYSDGQEDECCLYPHGFAYGDGTIGQGYPNHGYGDDFGMQGDGLVFAEIADVGAQELLVEEPLVKFLGASHIGTSGQ